MRSYNSTIEIKKKNLICGHFSYAFSKGRCKSCATREDSKRLNRNFIKDPQQSELGKWFEHRMQTCEPKCEECGAKAKWITREPYLKLWKSAQAHILPKRNFKSIATHPLNGLILFAGYSGVCSCHDKFDSNWRAASQMKIWQLVIERVKLLYPFIAEEELRFLPNEILKEL